MPNVLCTAAEMGSMFPRLGDSLLGEKKTRGNSTVGKQETKQANRHRGRPVEWRTELRCVLRHIYDFLDSAPLELFCV